MKRILTFLFFLLLFTGISGVNAAIIWQNNPDYEQFQYAINKNDGLFIYSPAQYLSSVQRTQFFAYNPTQGYYDPFGSVASGNFVEFSRSDIPGQLTVKAITKGPDGGQNPSNGVAVQALTDIVPDQLTINHGVRIEQQINSFMVRNFSVDQDDQYTVIANLTGLINFDEFVNSTSDQATFKIGADVHLEELTEGLGGMPIIREVDGFPVLLDENNRSKNVLVDLVKQDSLQRNVSYRLKVVLRIENFVTNLNLSQGTSITAPIAGTYQIGTLEEPLQLTALIGQDIVDSDGDGVPDAEDNCPTVANPDQSNADGDQYGDACDPCIQDVNNDDSDNDGTPDCTDGCPQDPAKIEPGSCGCGKPDSDVDGDGFICNDAFPNDPAEWVDTDGDGIGNNADKDDDNDGMPDLWEIDFGLDPLVNDADLDTDSDGVSNLREFKKGTDPTDASSIPQMSIGSALNLLLQDDNKGKPEVDTDGDGIPDAQDNCPAIANSDQIDSDSDGSGDLCDACVQDPDKILPGACGCGVPDTDDNQNGIPDCNELNCEDIIGEGCSLDAPQNLTSQVTKDSNDTVTQISLNWDTVECTNLYFLRIGTQSNITELPLGAPGMIELAVNSTSYSINAATMPPGTYYWAVIGACSMSAEDRGEWSEVKSYSY